jgi:hypothetical protein
MGRSVALSWCFEDECTPATKALLERVGEAGAAVPREADRRRQWTGFLHDLPLVIDRETTIRLWGASQVLGESDAVVPLGSLNRRDEHVRNPSA